MVLKCKLKFKSSAKMFFLIWLFAGVLPPNTEDFDPKKGLKKITEYKYNEEGKIVKVTAFKYYQWIDYQKMLLTVHVKQVVFKM